MTPALAECSSQLFVLGANEVYTLSQEAASFKPFTSNLFINQYTSDHTIFNNHLLGVTNQDTLKEGRVG